ncbi:MAG TPA: hypothetical protein VK183_02665, partial [Flavobacterium sp.]|nr:hypothetical protein [Flavobacterium sp.]
INTAKYNELATKEDRLSYLRALAIGSLINDAVSVFMEQEELILQGNFHSALTDKSRFKAQMDDIIALSIRNIYQSREVVEKELVGYQIIQTLLDTFIRALNNQAAGSITGYDKLVLRLLPERFRTEKEGLYERLLHVCHYVSLLTDGKALELYETIKGTHRVR